MDDRNRSGEHSHSHASGGSAGGQAGSQSGFGQTGTAGQGGRTLCPAQWRR